jgi:hypothetical protein
LIGIDLHEFGDHFVIAAPNALSEQPREKCELFRPELHQTNKRAASPTTLYQGRGSLHEADCLF